MSVRLGLVAPPLAFNQCRAPNFDDGCGTPTFQDAGVLMLIPVYLLFALCIGLTIVEIPPAVLSTMDLLVAFAVFGYFAMGGWLLQQITAVLKDLNGR